MLYTVGVFCTNFYLASVGTGNPVSPQSVPGAWRAGRTRQVTCPLVWSSPCHLFNSFLTSGRNKTIERNRKPTPCICHPLAAFSYLTENLSCTILTGEGCRGASHFKHIVRCKDGRYRRLVPDEIDQLQTFPRGWTNTGMTDGRRAFCMGSTLVFGVSHLIGRKICRRFG